MQQIIFLSHPEVIVDPSTPVPDWGLSEKGRSRMISFCQSRAVLANFTTVFTSCEKKAVDCGQIAHEIWSVPHVEIASLGEIDRSATGYLPPAEHSAVGREAFEHPDQSVRGWEPAVVAQRRIISALEQVCNDPRAQMGDILIVSHGGVGLLLLCHLLAEPITRRRVMQNPGGGCYYTIDFRTRLVLTLWQDMDGA